MKHKHLNFQYASSFLFNSLLSLSLEFLRHKFHTEETHKKEPRFFFGSLDGFLIPASKVLNNVLAYQCFLGGMI